MKSVAPVRRLDSYGRGQTVVEDADAEAQGVAPLQPYGPGASWLDESEGAPANRGWRKVTLPLLIGPLVALPTGAKAGGDWPDAGVVSDESTAGVGEADPLGSPMWKFTLRASSVSPTAVCYVLRYVPSGNHLRSIPILEYSSMQTMARD